MMSPTTTPIRKMTLVVPERADSTEIMLGRGLLARLPELLARYRNGRVVVVSDELVAPLYAAPVCDALNRSGYTAHLLSIPATEEAKNMDTLLHLYELCRSLRINRDDLVLAIGGGVVGDVAGMLANTYLRGLDLVQAPTSLLAMVSASIGGKVGVNLNDYKNLVGGFKHPCLVIADTKTLDTLAEIEYRSGLGELITAGVLGSSEIFESLESNGVADLDHLIWSAMRLKRDIVEADPFDRLGIRARLNLGHTFGHALEKLSGFRLPHGLGVAVGLHIAARFAAEMKLCPPSVPDRISLTLKALNLPVSLRGYEPAEMIEAMRFDKKSAAGRLKWVLPVNIGEVLLFDEENAPPGLLEAILRMLVLEGQS